MQYEKRYESATSMTAALKAGISDLFERIGCNTPAVRDLLGEEGLTEANLMAYLGIIEQRTNEILQVRGQRYLNAARVHEIRSVSQQVQCPILH